MNRLILVGNGFDLAHGLKTSYKDFIDDFWEYQIEKIRKNNFYNVENEFYSFFMKKVIIHTEDKFSTYKELINHPNYLIEFKNIFLKKISEKTVLQNWVDIENEYYNELKNVSEKDYSVNNLNKYFEEVKKLLIEYLNNIDKAINVNDKICRFIYKNFDLNDFSSDSIQRKINYEFAKRKKNLEALEDENISFEEMFETNSIEKEIHSKLLNKENKIEILKDIILNEGNSRKYQKEFELVPKQITF